MTILNKFLFFTMVFLAYSCNKEDNQVKRQIDDQGVVIATPNLWKTSLHNGDPFSNSYVVYPIIYNNSILVPTTSKGSRRNLSAIDIDKGEVLWCWDDSFSNGTEYLDVPCHVMYKNLLVFQLGTSSYCINLDNGTSHWRIKRDRSFDVRITSFGRSYFTYASTINNSNGLEEYVAFKGDIQTGNISEYLTANFTYECPECVRAVNYINQIPDQHNMLLVTYVENLPDWVNQVFFGLFDSDKNMWLWDRELIAPPQKENVVYYSPKIVNDKIYAAVANSIVCHDLTAGIQLWKRDFTNDFMFSGFIIEDGKLIANNEDLFTCCLDPKTGDILWKVNTAGTCSRMSYLNGIVYFVGGSVPKLFAIEASTGKIVWRIDASLIGESHEGKFRTNAVYVLPAKGGQPAKVIALTNLNAYCFEAYR